jgi:hypothetical protein
MQVARRQGKVDAHKDQGEVDSAPHDVESRGTPFESLAGLRRRISVVIDVVYLFAQKRGQWVFLVLAFVKQQLHADRGADYQ